MLFTLFINRNFFNFIIQIFVLCSIIYLVVSANSLLEIKLIFRKINGITLPIIQRQLFVLHSVPTQAYFTLGRKFVDILYNKQSIEFFNQLQRFLYSLIKQIGKYFSIMHRFIIVSLYDLNYGKGISCNATNSLRISIIIWETNVDNCQKIKLAF